MCISTERRINMKQENHIQNNPTISHAARILGMSRSAIKNAVKNGILEPIYGGLFHDRLVGVTAASVDAVVHRRHEIEAARAVNGKGSGSVNL